MGRLLRAVYHEATTTAAVDFGARAADVTQSASRIEADVRFLADDLLEGREAEQPSATTLASLYVATQYRMMGLQPGGRTTGGYFQTVPMLRGNRLREGARLAIVRNGTTTELAFQDHFIPSQSYDTDSCSVTSAAMVFVAQAVHARKWNRATDGGQLAPRQGRRSAGGLRRAFQTTSVPFTPTGTRRRARSRSVAPSARCCSANPVLEEKRAWEIVAAAWQRPGNARRRGRRPTH